MRLGLVRGAVRLDALTYAVDAPGGAPWRRAHVLALEPHTTGPVAEAFQRLATVERWDRATLGDVLLVLRETVPAAEPLSIAVLGDEIHPSRAPRATAAHPRAYRGTKHRPPRAAQPATVDVRPHLVSRRHVDAVLARLGYTGPVVHPDAIDPQFVQHLGPVFRGVPWREVAPFAELARAMELYVQPALRAALVGVYLAAGEPRRALAWWSHVLASDALLETAQMITASGAARREPAPPAGTTAWQRWCHYDGYARGASLAYLAYGVAIRAFVDASEAVPAGPRGTSDAIEGAIAFASEACADDEYDGADAWRRHLWWLCGRRPGFVDVLASPAFRALSPTVAFKIAQHAQAASRDDDDWAALAPLLPQMIALVGSIAPAYQRKAILLATDAFWWSLASGADCASAFAKCAPLVARLARPPFAVAPQLGELLPSLARVHTAHPACDAPDASWLELEASTHQPRPVSWGLHRLARAAPELLAEAFAREPRALIATADRLATVSFEAAAEILRAPSAIRGDEPIGHLVALVDPVAPTLVRRALRDHLAGARALTAAQLAGHRARILDARVAIRLAELQVAVDHALAAQIRAPALDAQTRHAAAMLEGAEDNRRALRRLLVAWTAGDRDWRLRHPATVAWFARHPRLDRAAWLAGVELVAGDVRLAVEHDPLEALKLGTYVGSCLSRQGKFAYGAAAVALDANKLVIYARDPTGAVVGRQLVAISEADELVCFHVYGVERDALASAFAAYDAALSAKLELPRAGETYEIATILAHRWYDDGAIA